MMEGTGPKHAPKQQSDIIHCLNHPALVTDLATPVIVGDLAKEGRKVLHYNCSNRNDAFALNKNTMVFCDGVGGYSKSGLIARELSKALVEYDDKLFEELDRTEYASLLESILANIQASPEYRERGKGDDDGRTGDTTLAIVHRNRDGNYSYFLADDSIIYEVISDDHYEKVGDEKTYKESKSTIGIYDEKIIVNIKKAHMGTIISKPGKRIVITTDWFNEYYTTTKDRGEEIFSTAKARLKELENQKGRGVAQNRKSAEANLERGKQLIVNGNDFNPLIFEDCSDPEEFARFASIPGAHPAYMLDRRSPDDATYGIIDCEQHGIFLAS